MARVNEAVVAAAVVVVVAAAVETPEDWKLVEELEECTAEKIAISNRKKCSKFQDI